LCFSTGNSICPRLAWHRKARNRVIKRNFVKDLNTTTSWLEVKIFLQNSRFYPSYFSMLAEFSFFFKGLNSMSDKYTVFII